MTAAASQNFRATHRVDAPGLPPLYCLRERDALAAAEERGDGSIISILVKNADNTETWEFWRTA